jgi:hypothetical protein
MEEQLQVIQLLVQQEAVELVQLVNLLLLIQDQQVEQVFH